MGGTEPREGTATERHRGPVLIVEDDEALRQVITWALEDAGLHVLQASDGQQALTLALLHRPALVLLDVNLPVLKGGGVAARLRSSLGDDLPIIIIIANQQIVQIAEHVGAYAYLSKPFEVTDLVAAVRAGLEA